MKTISFFFAAALILGINTVNAQGSLERKVLEPFTSLKINGDVDVYVNQSNEPGISASAKDLKSLQYQIVNGVLEINGGSENHIYVHTQGLSRIELSGNSDV